MKKSEGLPGANLRANLLGKMNELVIRNYQKACRNTGRGLRKTGSVAIVQHDVEEIPECGWSCTHQNTSPHINGKNHSVWLANLIFKTTRYSGRFFYFKLFNIQR